MKYGTPLTPPTLFGSGRYQIVPVWCRVFDGRPGQVVWFVEDTQTLDEFGVPEFTGSADNLREAMTLARKVEDGRPVRKCQRAGGEVG